MRISDLSRESGLSIPTIKFYLREGLVPPGERTSPNQATYNGSHLARLRLIRVLAEVGGVSLTDIRRIVEAIADDRLSQAQVLGVAHRAVDGALAEGEETGQARQEVDAWIADRGWSVAADAPARSTLASVLEALRGLGWQLGPEVFDRYADHMDQIARDELAFVGRANSREAAVEGTVVGTVVFERAMAALRRMAQEHHATAGDNGRDGDPPAHA